MTHPDKLNLERLAALAAITDHDEMYRLATLSQVALPRLLAALRGLPQYGINGFDQMERDERGGWIHVDDLEKTLTDLDLGASTEPQADAPPESPR